MLVGLLPFVGARCLAEPTFRAEVAVTGAARFPLDAGASVADRHVQSAFGGLVARRIVLSGPAAAAKREIVILLGGQNGLGVSGSAVVVHWNLADGERRTFDRRIP